MLVQSPEEARDPLTTGFAQLTGEPSAVNSISALVYPEFQLADSGPPDIHGEQAHRDGVDQCLGTCLPNLELLQWIRT